MRSYRPKQQVEPVRKCNPPLCLSVINTINWIINESLLFHMGLQKQNYPSTKACAGYTVAAPTKQI